ncbi:MAG: PqqD family protein [Actinomycetota bacterium]
MTASRFSQRPGVLQRVVGEEILVTTARSTEISSLSGSAALQWRMLDEPRTLDEIVSGLAGVYGVASRAIRSDVEALLDELLRRDLAQEGIDDD